MRGSCGWRICGGLLTVRLRAQRSAPKATVNGDWPLYRHDLAGTGYSPVAQITVQNVASLKQVWSYRLSSDVSAPDAKGKGKGAGGANSEATPIVVNLSAASGVGGNTQFVPAIVVITSCRIAAAAHNMRVVSLVRKHCMSAPIEIS